MNNHLIYYIIFNKTDDYYLNYNLYIKKFNTILTYVIVKLIMVEGKLIKWSYNFIINVIDYKWSIIKFVNME